MTTATCVHRYEVGPPAAIMSGKCKLCGHEREFDPFASQEKYMQAKNKSEKVPAEIVKIY